MWQQQSFEERSRCSGNEEQSDTRERNLHQEMNRNSMTASVESERAAAQATGRSRRPCHVFVGLLLFMACSGGVDGFTVNSVPKPLSPRLLSVPQTTSSTSLNVWWFGGTESASEMNQDGDSCELVAVRIERTSPNSRRIAGSITVPGSVEDTWAIVTDYNNLATHVPNLVESRIVSKPTPRGKAGDGSFRCDLFQKGAQKIVGFEFGASVTMAMKEQILSEKERKVEFKCIDSFFFTEFDGEWKMSEKVVENGEVETELDYVVDVRPKGPVPVAALEWRIREDVPTNLRAVKTAAIKGQEVTIVRQPVSDAAALSETMPRQTTRGNGLAGEKRYKPKPKRTLVAKESLVRNAAKQERSSSQSLLRKEIRLDNRSKRVDGAGSSTQRKSTPLPFKVRWEADETMAAYLSE